MRRLIGLKLAQNNALVVSVGAFLASHKSEKDTKKEIIWWLNPTALARKQLRPNKPFDLSAFEQVWQRPIVRVHRAVADCNHWIVLPKEYSEKENGLEFISSIILFVTHL